MKPHPGHSIPRYLSPTLVTGSLPARELYFLCIIFLSWVLPLVKQINHRLTPGQLIIHSGLLSSHLHLSGNPPAAHGVWPCAFSERSRVLCSFIKLCKVLSYTSSHWNLANPFWPYLNFMAWKMETQRSDVQAASPFSNEWLAHVGLRAAVCLG